MTDFAFETVFDFSGKVALVTGGASGIGFAIAQTFAARGARLALLDRDPRVSDVAAGLGGAGQHLGIAVDVTDDAALTEAVDRVAASCGRIDVLVNNAGFARLAPAEDVTMEDWDAHIALNLRAPFLMSRQVGRVMLQQGSGRIVNIASQAGIVALPHHVAYSAAKAAIINMSKLLALEWGPRGITVNAISPTIVETELGRRVWAGEPGETMKQRIPTRRFAQPEEIALAALYLASGAAGMVNGENLVVDGGFTIQ
ncbi:SDR family oxidoreductase [Lichenicoccus roseus]|uniref:D-threitol dehydrogenase n=1 Tax=Lichenicoccus roseus TaxID=2683649 RepID=A0A5R9JFV8_9PROT|nr:D-threitol dehydrogenase [Lichenicoccus roseus]TLU74551.1 D-threitol dehydrogenase [Lichenicoccus roseus]